jgi:hypothetical protein
MFRETHPILGTRDIQRAIVFDTPWGTREFDLYDVDHNALTFYRDLTRAEKERLMSERDGPRSGPEGSMALP